MFFSFRRRVACCACLVLAAWGRSAAAPITSAAFFNSIPHTHLTFDVDGLGVTLPVLSNITLPAAEYAAQGVTILPSVRAVRDNDSCFRNVQYNIAGGSSPYGIAASQTQSLVFNPPVNAFGFVFVATQFQFATFTARDAANNVIETATFAPPFAVANGACGFLEYGFLGISSTTPIASVTISAPSGMIDNLRFAVLDSDGDGVTDNLDNCVTAPNPLQENFDGDALGDACDPDDDNDTVPDGQDAAPLNCFVCRDADLDGCDDCASGVENAANDGLDTDSDGLCNTGDADDDNDGVPDGADSAPLNPSVCRDVDGDGCDDCNSGFDDPFDDGFDFDADGLCDFGDSDDDGDTVPDDQDDNPFNRFVCRDADGDGCEDCTTGTDAPAADGPDFDVDGLCNAGDADDDNDGLPDVLEAGYGTNPLDSDSDNDGLLDGTEVDSAMGSGCPDPAVADSDGDTISDGDEVAGNTNPCSTDTDGDGLSDNTDPTPTIPGAPAEFIEEAVRELASMEIPSLDLTLFTGPNNNSNRGRRNALANRAAKAANRIADGDYDRAINDLESALARIDGESPPPDWMLASPEKTALAAEIELLIALLELLP